MKRLLAGKFFQSKLIKKVVAPALRAFGKQVPVIGPPIVETLTNLTLPKGEKKHSNVSVIIQFIIAAIILYSLFSGDIDSAKAIKELKDVE